MKSFQKEVKLAPKARGFHLITDELLEQFPDVQKIETGILNIFLKHTSAGLAINENADATVRADFEKHFNVMVPENQPYYKHTYEGSDDMPAHIKSALTGVSLQIPITNGRLNLGIWQGVYLCEYRNHGGSRKVILTANGI